MIELNQETVSRLLNSYVDHDLPRLRMPFPVTYQQEEWYTATNGKELLMIRKNDAKAAIIDIPNYKTPNVAAVLPDSYREIAIPWELISSVYESAPVSEVDEVETCECCDGVGKFDHYGEIYDCMLCEETGEMKTGRKVSLRGKDYAVAIDGKHVDFRLYERTYNLIRTLKPDTISFLQQQEKPALSGFMLDGSVMIWMAGISGTREMKVIILPVEVK